MVEDKKGQKVSWNAAEGIIQEISNRRVTANSFFIKGDINRAFSSLIAIKQSVVQSLLMKEREKLNLIEERFRKISPALSSGSSGSFNPKQREAFRLAKGIAMKIYPEFNDLLMDLLHERGYLVGEASDASRMKF
jgi:hypothetical protein